MLETMISIKSAAEIEAMRIVGKLAARTLRLAGETLKPGLSTDDINDFVHEYTLKNGGIPAPLNYKGFPKSVCTSVNDVVCHGIPTKTVVLEDGDIINIDVTTILNGFHGDTSRTFIVGAVAEEVLDLVLASDEAMYKGISVVKPGARIRDIGIAIQQVADARGFSLVREYVGHGIGRGFHEPPNVPNYDTRGRNLPTVRMRPGMIFTVEPILNAGSSSISHDKDGWTVRTADGKLSAQAEHTVLVTETGYEILTKE